MVLESIKDSKVPVHCDGEQAANGCEQGATDDRVNDIVNVHGETLRIRVCIVQQGDGNCFGSVRDAHQHISHSQAADEKVHGGMQVLVLGYGHNHQDILQQADDTQSHKHLRRDEKLLIAPSIGVAFPQGLAGVAVQPVGAEVPEVERGVHSMVVSGIHPGSVGSNPLGTASAPGSGGLRGFLQVFFCAL